MTPDAYTRQRTLLGKDDNYADDNNEYHTASFGIVISMI